MKILQISTYDVNGGAARATYRLHRGLHAIGQDCRMVVKNKESADDAVILADAEEKPENPNEDFFLSAGHLFSTRDIEVHEPGIDAIINGRWITDHTGSLNYRTADRTPLNPEPPEPLNP